MCHRESEAPYSEDSRANLGVQRKSYFLRSAKWQGSKSMKLLFFLMLTVAALLYFLSTHCAWDRLRVCQHMAKTHCHCKWCLANQEIHRSKRCKPGWAGELVPFALPWLASFGHIMSGHCIPKEMDNDQRVWLEDSWVEQQTKPVSFQGFLLPSSCLLNFEGGGSMVRIPVVWSPLRPCPTDLSWLFMACQHAGKLEDAKYHSHKANSTPSLFAFQWNMDGLGKLSTCRCRVLH